MGQRPPAESLALHGCNQCYNPLIRSIVSPSLLYKSALGGGGGVGGGVCVCVCCGDVLGDLGGRDEKRGIVGVLGGRAGTAEGMK